VVLRSTGNLGALAARIVLSGGQRGTGPETKVSFRSFWRAPVTKMSCPNVS